MQKKTETVKKAQSNAVLVLGAGNFGTCLAQHLAKMNRQIFLWDRDEATIRSINEHRKNPRYLSSYEVHPNVCAVSDLNNLENE